ncbi:MAG: hypothetical protein KY455_04035 [Euryarchaeota archaeon]|nr:hypothetical protein [Euryarchaeota archaeon]
MARVRIVLDTGVLWRPGAMDQIAQMDVPLVLPAVAFMERARQVRRDGGDVARFRAWLERMHIGVEPFAESEAERIAVRLVDDRVWRRLVRDAMIAGHVRKDDLLYTTNPKDFVRVGLDPDRIVGV